MDCTTQCTEKIYTQKHIYQDISPLLSSAQWNIKNIYTHILNVELNIGEEMGKLINTLQKKVLM